MVRKKCFFSALLLFIITLSLCGCSAFSPEKGDRLDSDNGGRSKSVDEKRLEGVWYGLTFSSLGDISEDGYTFDKIIFRESAQYNSDYHGNGFYQREDGENIFLTSDTGDITQLRIGSGKDAAEAFGVSKIRASLVLITAETPDLNDGYTVYFPSEKEWQAACDVLYSEKTEEFSSVLTDYTWCGFDETWGEVLYYIFDQKSFSIVTGSSDAQGNVNITSYVHKDVPYKMTDPNTMIIGSGNATETIPFFLTQEATGVDEGEGYRLQINGDSGIIPEWEGQTFLGTAVEYYVTGY